VPPKKKSRRNSGTGKAARSEAAKKAAATRLKKRLLKERAIAGWLEFRDAASGFVTNYNSTAEGLRFPAAISLAETALTVIRATRKLQHTTLGVKMAVTYRAEVAQLHAALQVKEFSIESFHKEWAAGKDEKDVSLLSCDAYRFGLESDPASGPLLFSHEGIKRSAGECAVFLFSRALGEIK